MRMRKAIMQSVAIVSILVLAILAGYVWDRICHQMDLRAYPREFSAYVEEYAAKYGVPEAVVYAVIKAESNFESNKLSEDGRIGLMQLSPEMFAYVLTLTKETKDIGILYDPESNIRYGTYLLSYFYTEYSRWNTVYACYWAGTDAVNRWLAESTLVDSMGNLKKIPDDATKAFVEKTTEAQTMYQTLYYTPT